MSRSGLIESRTSSEQHHDLLLCRRGRTMVTKSDFLLSEQTDGFHVARGINTRSVKVSFY